MTPKTILTGITSTGTLTLGNYLGALKSIIDLQHDNNLIVFIADLHAITIPIDNTILHHNIRSIAALLIACGVDTKKAIMFVQSDVIELSQLSHILLCNTTLGELKRMTQFKDKALKLKQQNLTNFVPVGLLTYPTLMAGDILAFDSDLVPVGKDQKQHLELTRNLAEKMNKKYQTQLFKLPDVYFPKIGAKIMDLQNPTKKMSKSSNDPKTYIALLDPPAVIQKKIRQSLTDSENKVYYDLKNKPGISNLLTIYCALKNISIKAGEAEFKDKNYGEFKTAVSEAIIDTLKPLQDQYKKIYKSSTLDKILHEGANQARSIVNAKLSRVKTAVGLTYEYRGNKN